jgi:spore germination protein YaaH
MKQRIAVLVAVTALLGLPVPTVASDPTWSSVTLADGTVLAPLPAAMLTPSIGAEMLAAGLPLPAGSTAPPSAAANDVEGVGGIIGSPGRGSGAMGPAGPLPNGLSHEILGFLPYWQLDPGPLDGLRYDLVSTIAYFSIGAQADGTLLTGSTASPSTGWRGWTGGAMADVMIRAHATGVRVVPTITMMAWGGDYTAMTTLLNDPAHRATLIAQIVATVGDRTADGVNLDFEPVPTSLRDAFTTFVRELKAGLVAAGVGSYLTVDTMAGAASWATGYDVAALSATGAADALMVMAYDFSWSGSARAGGVAPLGSPYIYDATDAMNAYTAAVSPAKLIWGIPYYGRTWPTLDASPNALTCRATTPPVCPDSTVSSPGASKSYYYTGARHLSDLYGRLWDAGGQVPWFAWFDDATHTWNEGYYDDAQSLSAKYALVKERGVAGIGIWTLLMDAGTQDLSDVLASNFVPQVTRIGGPDRYAVSAGISFNTFAPGVPVAYVAVGTKFPDALSAGPAAAHQGGPVLLTGPTSLPAAIAAELARLAPQRIVVVGGPASVSDAVIAQLDAYTTGPVTRIGGPDRYAVSAGISFNTFGPGASVYLANGGNFPDALSGGPAAGVADRPLLLTTTDSLPPAIAAEIARLSPTHGYVLGGPASVSQAVLVQFQALLP